MEQHQRTGPLRDRWQQRGRPYPHPRGRRRSPGSLILQRRGQRGGLPSVSPATRTGRRDRRSQCPACRTRSAEGPRKAPYRSRATTDNPSHRRDSRRSRGRTRDRCRRHRPTGRRSRRRRCAHIESRPPPGPRPQPPTVMPAFSINSQQESDTRRHDRSATGSRTCTRTSFRATPTTPRPGWPFPFPEPDPDPGPMPEERLARDVAALRAALAP